MGDFLYFLYKIKRFILSLFYPPKCPYCKTILKPDALLCDSCTKKLKVEPIVRLINLGEHNCISVITAFSYEDKIKDAICEFKFKNRLDYVEHFAQSIAEAMEITKNNIKNFDFICCVPMSREHERKRGYNQAEVLAKAIGKIFKLPFKDVLVKVKKTKTQHTLARNERIVNVKGAYVVLNKENVLGRKVLLCDDILTTGSTIKECAIALFNSGASEVLAVCIANRK